MVRNRVNSPKRREIVAAACKRFPKLPALALAKKLYADHPMLFPNAEAARMAILGHLGKHGAASRKKAAERGTLRPHGKPSDRTPIPKSKARPFTPFILDARRVLVLSDLHVPFHDVEAIEAALEYGERFKPDAILWNGDFFDFYSLSRYERRPDGPTAKQEIKAGSRIFRLVRERFPKARQVFKLGNHDERWEDFLCRKAPELWDATRFSWQKHARLRKYGVEVVRDKRPIMLGKLMVLHGHEKGRGISSPVNPARGAFMRLLCSTLEGHGHRTSEHTERTADGRVIACRTTGCLCELHPDYARFNKWDHGFATVIVEPTSGDYECRLHRIVKGKVV